MEFLIIQFILFVLFSINLGFIILLEGSIDEFSKLYGTSIHYKGIYKGIQELNMRTPFTIIIAIPVILVILILNIWCYINFLPFMLLEKLVKSNMLRSIIMK